MTDSMTFMVNDFRDAGSPNVWVTISEMENGTLKFSVTQDSTIIGDLRGLFFDLADESLLKSLSVNALSAGLTQMQQGDDTIKNLGNGSNMNGLLGSGTDTNGYDVGIEIGTAGIGKDDYGSFSFVLSSSMRSLTLQDFSNVDFGVRLTSVGLDGGVRTDSSKILELTSVAINAQNDEVRVQEDNSVTGNVLSNDMVGLRSTDVVSVTGFSGGAIGEVIHLSDAEGTTLQLYANGSYLIDASMANALSEGEVLTYHFDYTAMAKHELTSFSQSDGMFTVIINGMNDGPVAMNDSGTVAENAILSGNLLANDFDVDRLDTIHLVSVNGQMLDANGTLTTTLASGAVVTVYSDGRYVFDTNGAFNALNNGEKANDSITYTIADNHGAESSATLNVEILGSGTIVEPPPKLPVYGLSHGYWKNHDGIHNPDDWNIAHDTSFENYFGVDLNWTVRDGGKVLRFEDILFSDGLELGGGGQNALAREAITAVLNALDEKNGTVYDFAYTADEVVDMVYAAYTSGSASVIESTKDLLESTHI